MKRDEQEKLYKQLADEYVKAYGEELIKQNGLNAMPENMLERLRAETLKKKRSSRRFAGLVTALAACVVLAIALPSLITDDGGKGAVPPEETNASADRIIPLSFSLPDNLSVSESKLDQKKSIYILEDEFDDDVVLVMEIPEQKLDVSGMTKLAINGKPAYALSSSGYNLVTFFDGGILYTLTCEQDLATILDLGASIL